MKATTEKAIVAYRILNNAKISKMKDGDKFNIVKIMKELKPIATGYDDFLKDATKKLEPEGVEEIQKKINPAFSLPPEQQRNEIVKLLSADELAMWDKFNSDVAKCVDEELSKEIKFKFKPLSEEGFKGLIGSNDFAMSQIMALYDVIGE